MHIEELLLDLLTSAPLTYRDLRRAVFFPTKPRYSRFMRKQSSEAVFATTLSRLKAQGLVKKDARGSWHIVVKGRRKLEQLRKKIDFPEHSSKKNAEGKLRNIIITFDIPETHKAYRNWLRSELKILDFDMLHKSVWIGRGPLPEELISNLKDMSMFRYVHIFDVKSLGTVPGRTHYQ